MVGLLSTREFILVLGVGFLLALLVLGALAYFAIRLLNRRETGETAAGVTGCAIAGVLGCLGLCAFGAFALLALLFVGGKIAERAIDHLPAGRWHYEHSESVPPPAGPGARWNDRAELVFRATGENVDFSDAIALVREIAGGTTSTTLSSSVDAGGTAISELRVGVIANGDELLRIDDAVEARAGELRTPKGLEIEYLGVRRDV
ncbi:MAG: hypothetical protein L6Q99_21650 [Planctomycetes bacterium]|nr:hypothetical protein [Planctomycetota bacterium]